MLKPQKLAMAFAGTAAFCYTVFAFLAMTMPEQMMRFVATASFGMFEPAMVNVTPNMYVTGLIAKAAGAYVCGFVFAHIYNRVTGRK